jgi:uncharacterized repeat protein (TIGR02543 family)
MPTVIFFENGGTGAMNPQIANVPTPLIPNTFTRTGYTFWHWNEKVDDSGTIYTNQAIYQFNQPVSLYAQWTGNTLTVTFNTQGGSAVSSTTTTSGGIMTNPGESIRPGYTFLGWFTSASGGSPIPFPYTHNQTSNFILYAQWSPTPFKIFWNTQGGTPIPADSTGIPGGIISAAPTPQPTKTGFNFLGWFLNPSGGTAVVFPYTIPTTNGLGQEILYSSFYFYAQWSAASPFVNFDCNSVRFDTQLVSGTAVNSTITIPYTDGNGLTFTTSSISSTGVTGLTVAQLNGTLANGNGELVFTVTGTPSAAGNATFNFNIFGVTCQKTYNVIAPTPNSLNTEEACVGDTVTFSNPSCNIVSNVNAVTVGGVSTTANAQNCTIDFLVPEGVTTIGSTNVVFYNNTAVLESLPLEIIPCGINYFGPDANTGAQACSTITYNNPDCSIVNNVASIVINGEEVEWGIISSTSTCKLFINLPEIERPGFVKIEFIGEDGRQFVSESYKITATCNGREEELPLDLNCLSLLQTDNLTFLDCNNNPVPFEEGAVFTQTGWTISFSTELGVWESRHTYRPYMYMYNSKAMYTLTRINEEDSIWKHTEKATRLSYYNNINVSNIFEIDIIFPGEDRRTATGATTTKNSNKLFSAFAITSDVFNSDINGDQNLFTIPFNKFYVYNSFQLSGEVDFKYLDNIRRVDGSWVINDFRDMSLYTNNNPGQSLMFLQEGVINSSYINSNKNWYEKRKFVDKWIGIRLILDNSPSNLVYLYNVVFNSRPSFR